jgi:hypothetical protein
MTMRWRRLATITAVFVIALTACSVQELVELFDVVDLETHEDPVKQAAGDAAEALDKDRAAQRMADEGLRERAPEKLEEALQERPRDPRYRIYRAAFELANGNRDEYLRGLEEAAGIAWADLAATIEGLGLGRDDEETQRIILEAEFRWFKTVLEGLDWALAIERGRVPVEVERIERLESRFCKLHSGYLAQYGQPSGGAPLLAFVGGANCQDTP